MPLASPVRLRQLFFNDRRRRGGLRARIAVIRKLIGRGAPCKLFLTAQGKSVQVLACLRNCFAVAWKRSIAVRCRPVLIAIAFQSQTLSRK